MASLRLIHNVEASAGREEKTRLKYFSITTRRSPGHPINFVWLMAAHREVEDRQFGVVTVQPGFDQAGSGLEASRK